MEVLEYIMEKKRKNKKMHFSLLDPEKQAPQKAGEVAGTVTEHGSNLIMVGGSSPISKERLDQTIREIRRRTPLKIVLFPSSVGYLSPLADAVLFMSLLNSNDLDYVIRVPAKGAPIIKRMGIEPISMGYLIIEPGMTAGKVGKADLIKRDDTKSVVEYALYAQYNGMKLFYIDAGSGSPEPVPTEMIRAVKKEAGDIVLLIGGGISNAQIARDILEAGADAIVTGTSLERGEIKQIQEIISATKV